MVEMIPCPKDEKYLSFQEEAIEFARGKRSVLLGDEMGLGKSIEAIGWLNCHPEVEEVLIVCPASLRINWAREVDKWLISPCVDVTIINYDVLHKLDMSKEYDLLILDEAHYVKSLAAKRSKYARTIKAKHKLALTGTPLLNRPEEIFHILHILDPMAWPMSSYRKFTIRYCNAHNGRFGWDTSGASHLDELRELLQPVMVRRLKKDVLKELPAKRRQVVEFPLDSISVKQRKEIVALAEGLERAKEMDPKGMAVRACYARFSHATGRAKVPMALGFIEDSIESSGKVVIFGHHRDVLEELQMGLAEYFPAVIHGETPQAMRQSAVDRFQGDSKCRVFIGNIQAAGVGITLTASSTVVFVELNWVPGVMSQAEDRVHRIGQAESVLVQHLVLEGSLDAQMARTLIRKQGIIDKTMGG